MLYMVIERVLPDNVERVGERFARNGRMLPPGVSYLASWVERDGGRCFQVMEAPGPAEIQEWTRNWRDLVEFEVVPVQTSADFWASRARG